MPDGLRDFLDRLGGWRRIATIGVGLGAIALIVGVSRWATAPAYVPLFNAVSLEESANVCLARFICRHRTYLEQLYTYGDPSRHPARRVVSVVYFSLIPSDAFCAPAEPVTWFPVDDLPALALDTADILAYAVRRLRYKLEYSAAGFELLPEFFTLSELQRTYEMILGERLDKRNFRRRILQAGIIETTTQRRSGEGRPAQLYRYRPDAVAEVKARRLFP